MKEMPIIIEDKYLSPIYIKVSWCSKLSHRKIDKLKLFILPHSVLVFLAVITDRHNFMAGSYINYSSKDKKFKMGLTM